MDSRDTDGLARNDKLRNELLQQIVSQYAVLTNAQDTAYVLRKLCSTLVAYFLQSSSEWQLPIRHVLASISEHQPALQWQQGTKPLTSQAIALLSSGKPIGYHQLRGILWLCLSLVEDVVRSDPKGREGYSNLSSTLSLRLTNIQSTTDQQSCWECRRYLAVACCDPSKLSSTYGNPRYDEHGNSKRISCYDG